jgi:hypothetical protein
MMTGSFNFVLHLIAFGTLSASVVALYVLDRKMRSEGDVGKKLYLGGLMRIFALFGPFNTVVLLLTGIGNMVNRYGTGGPWTIETWLIVKIIIFFILVFNGMVVASRLSQKRMMLLKAVAENSAPADSEQQLAAVNSRFSVLFIVQFILLLTVVILSVFGDGKHPGTF